MRPPTDMDTIAVPNGTLHGGFTESSCEIQLRASEIAADSRCSRRRSAGRADGTTLFRSVSSDEDGGNLANIAASGASNRTERDARAAQNQMAG